MDACPAAGTAAGLVVRLMPWRVDDGPANMALDEALLATAAAGEATLRFYGWAAPNLTLGYFQPSAPALAQHHLPWLRRATGGAALVHHHELTYALALPPGRGWQPPGAAWICTFHHAVRRALETLGVAAHVCTEEKKLGDVLCFRHHTPGDLLVGGDKVAGSAQRKSHGAVLQHGGILLARSPHAPILPGINDLTGRGLSAADVREAITAAFTAATGWVPKSDGFRPSEIEAAARIEAERYRSPEWNGRR